MSDALSNALANVREGFVETLSYMPSRARTGAACGPTTRWNGSTERVVGDFPHGRSALLQVAARLQRIDGHTV